jgi:hypothetical protein
MAAHDEYGKRVLTEATVGQCIFYGEPVETHHGFGGPCRIDGAIIDIAIEVESRTSKQVRGAILDLICHRSQKKLLVLLPVHMNVLIEKPRCEAILKRFCAVENFRVIALTGYAGAPQLAPDAERVEMALTELGYRRAAAV